LQTQNNFYLFIYLLTIIIIININCKTKNVFRPEHGDLLFQDLDSSPLCDAIEEVTRGINHSNLSHMGIVTIIDNQYYVLEAFTNGVDTVILDKFLNRSVDSNGKPKIIVGRLKIEYSKLIPKAIDEGIKLVGEKYDDEFKINNNKFYCSELIYDIFLSANNRKEFFHLNPMTYKVNGKTLDIWKEYFQNLNISIPENEPGINPAGISLSEKIDIIYNYAN